MNKDNLHYYQKFCVEHIVNNNISAILLSCGLGKTVITLTAIEELMYDRFDVRKVLVIAPLRVTNVWAEEIQRWEHLRHLTYSIAVGNAAERMEALRRQADIHIINRENVRWLVESGLPFDYDMVVLDELSSFKNHQAKRFKALMKVRPKVKRIVGLTGTPASNGLMDLWAEFRLLDMGKRLGRFISNYRREYFIPDRYNGNIVYSYKPLPHTEACIYRAISDITISMKCTDHLNMPELVNNEVLVKLNTKERKHYDRLKRDLILTLTDGEITASNAAALSNKLIQMANGAVYGDDGEAVEIHARKLDALEDLIEAANGKPVLVAYWYKHDLERIRARFDIREIKTQQDIDDWNAGNIPVALIHPASAGHGLNLQAGGSTLVWFGLTWSLELYQQTVARLWRQGQNSQTVVVHHIIT